MAKKYKDGEYMAVYNDCYPSYEIVKGWSDKAHCQKKISQEFGEGEKKVCRIEHKYGFWGVGLDDMGEPCQLLYEREEPGRGRFKITLAYTEDSHAVPKSAVSVNEKCPNCGQVEDLGNECKLEPTVNGFYCRCPDCGVESSVYGTSQAALDSFFCLPANSIGE